MKVFLVSISPLDVFLWIVRRNEKDIVNLYDKLSPIMQTATGGSMLNFGLWNKTTRDPLSAQKNMCAYFSELSELSTADLIADVGSGLDEPAHFWKNQNPHLRIFCVNINFKQLCFAQNFQLDKVNSTAVHLPFRKNSLDRVISLESAQHFKPLKSFFKETKRVLKKSGILAMAIPVTMKNSSAKRLGILNFTWSSEHYSDTHVMEMLDHVGFKILSKKFIGPEIYDPLADYYVENRESIKQNILKQYPLFVEPVLFHSILKMKKASQDNVINYLILKCKI